MATPPLPPELDVSVPVTTARGYPPWSGADVLLVALAFVISGLGVTFAAVLLMLALVPGLKPQELAKMPALAIAVQTAAYAITLGITYLLVTARSGGEARDALRLQRPAMGLPVFAMAGIALALAVQFVGNFLPIPKQLPIEEMFRSRPTAFAVMAFGILVAPLAEEIFFRGLLLPVLRRRWGVAAAVILSSLLFAFIHQAQLAAAWAPLLLIFVVGVALGVTRVKTDSVAACVMLHMAYNATLFTLIYVGTDGFRNLDALRN